MPLDREAFFEVMASFPTGVAIVTTVSGDGAPRGLTTTAVCSVSADPPTILVCVDLGSRTLAALREARLRGQLRGRGTERALPAVRLEGGRQVRPRHLATDPGRPPVLHDDVLAWAECSTLHELEVGDHVILVAQVDDGGVQPELEPPLMYYRRSWGAWSPVHGSAEPDVSIHAIEVSGRDLRWQGGRVPGSARERESGG